MLTTNHKANNFPFSMVDRVFAIWQVLNPDSYVTPQTSLFGTYSTARGSVEDANTSESMFSGSQILALPKSSISTTTLFEDCIANKIH